MSFLVTVIGSFTLPPGGLDAWRARPVDPARFRDWPGDGEDGMLFTQPAVAPTVGALLDAAAAELGGAGDPSFLEASVDGGRATVAGVLIGEETILRWHASIAAALREAAAAGAVGVAALAMPAFQGANRITLRAGKRGKPGQSAIEPVPINELFADDAVAVVAIALDGWLGAVQRDPTLTRAAYRAGEATFWLDAEPTAPEAAALAAARALDDAALGRALADAEVLTPGLQPLRARTPDVAALRAELAAATPLARTVAIELCGHADADAAEPLARALLAHRSGYVVRMATRALAGARGDAALDALAELALTHPSEWPSAVEALRRLRHPGVAARVAAMVRRELDVDPRALSEAGREARLDRGRRAVELGAMIVAPEVCAALLAVFDDPRARWIVPRLATAILGQGEPAAARADELQLAAFGMGRALNPDATRRAALLGLDPDDDSGGIVRYDDLDLAGLTALVEEGFIHPAARQNEAPSTADFFQLLTAWPELRATGYAVVPSRPDYRVMIDGVTADLAEMAPDRAAALREVLAGLADGASTAELDGDDVALWWT